MSVTENVINGEVISRAFRDAMRRKGYTQATLAKKIEEQTGKRPAQSTISNWTRGEKIPRAKQLPVVLDVLDLSWEDIGLAPPASDRGDGAASGKGVAQPVPAQSELDDVVLIPRVARAAAGDGYLNDAYPEVEGYDAYPLNEIKRLTNAHPDDLRTITVVGDSLEPEILANSTVVYAPTEEITEHGLYVFAIDDTLLIKKIQRFAGGALEIIPINETYSRELLVPVKDVDQPNLYLSKQSGLVATFRVVGRVVFYLKTA